MFVTPSKISKQVNFKIFLFAPFILIVSLFIFSIHAFSQSDTIQTTVPALKDVYANDFTIGCLLSYRNIGFSTDTYVPGQSAVSTPNGGYLIKYHMNCMSPGNNMKPQYTLDISGSASAYKNAATSQAKDSIDVYPIVRFNGDIIAQLNWAKKQGFTFRGHTLIWHSQSPMEFFRSGYTSTGSRLTKDKMIQRMDNYIANIIRLLHERWPKLLSAMDVVNEAVNDSGNDRTTDSEWYVTFGDNSYLMKAFELTRKYTILYGETQLKLYYNDYNTDISAKADGIVRICKPIFEAGYLDGIGMQDHDAITNPTAASWIKSYDKFSAVCNEMAVTELDVTTGSASPAADILANQANQYGSLFKCFVERSFKSGRGKIINVSKDGLNDAYTFKTNQSSSLWDSKNQCKPAFYAVVDVGKNYNSLDSMITTANSMKEKDYTAASWSKFSSTLASAKNSKTQNYSAVISAATSLSDAKNNLKTAIDGLVMVSTGVNITNNKTAKEFSLSQNYPNPFNPSTTIEFSLPEEGFVQLKIYDILGHEVKTLINGKIKSGYHSVLFESKELNSGIYIYQLKTEHFVKSQKMIISK